MIGKAMFSVMAVVAMLVIAFSIAGCETNSSETNSPEPTYQTSSPPVEEDVISEPAFIETARANLLGMAYEDAALLELGNSVCSKYGNGQSVLSIINEMNGAGLDSRTTGVIAGAAGKHLCPQYKYAMMEELKDILY